MNFFENLSICTDEPQEKVAAQNFASYFNFDITFECYVIGLLCLSVSSYESVYKFTDSITASLSQTEMADKLGISILSQYILKNQHQFDSLYNPRSNIIPCPFPFPSHLSELTTMLNKSLDILEGKFTIKIHQNINK